MVTFPQVSSYDVSIFCFAPAASLQAAVTRELKSNARTTGRTGLRRCRNHLRTNNLSKAWPSTAPPFALRFDNSRQSAVNPCQSSCVGMESGLTVL
jgi:hypothetical protein